jgi:hypothetical protein
MFVASERFLSHLIKEYGEYPVSIDGGTWYPTSLSIFETKTSSSFFCIRG